MVERVTVQSPVSGFEAPAEAEVSPTTEATTPSDTTERPAWLPEEFDTPEAFAAHYATLKAGDESASEEAPAETPDTGTEESPEGEGEETEEQETPEPSGDPVRDLLTSKGVNYDDLTDQYATDGKLSDENYAKLADAGYPQELVDNYLDGERLRSAANNTRLYGIVGGEEQFAVMATWAGTTLDPKEVENLNKAFKSGNAASAEMAMATLKMKYEAANGRAPKLLGGKGKGGTPLDTFKSAAEVSAAINNPKYRTDPAYRQSVQDKIARSNVL